MELKRALEQMYRNVIDLYIDGAGDERIAVTRFGGVPDVPKDFVWPVFEMAGSKEGPVKCLPLSFLVQFNCADIAELDKEGLLPKSGLLSFFYEMDSQCWGFDPRDKGCARVFWFEDVQNLVPADFPRDLQEEFRFPVVGITAEANDYLPDWQDFATAKKEFEHDWDQFEEERIMLGCEEDSNASKLLGWPDVIQNNMTCECELVTRGHYLGNTWDEIPEADIQYALQNSIREWQMLLQLDTVETEDFGLMFGDCGRLYFYIRKTDLAERRFDRVWLILQCY